MAMPQTQKAKPHLSLRWRIVLLVSAAALISVTVAVAISVNWRSDFLTMGFLILEETK